MTEERGRLLLLVPDDSYRVGDFLRAADRVGVSVTVATRHRQALEQLSLGRAICIDFSDIERGVEQILVSAKVQPYRAIIATDEATTLFAALAGSALGLPVNTPHAVRACVNKYRFRRCLDRSGVLGPNFSLVRCDQNAELIARDLTFPCVLKPLSLSGSRGVIRANDGKEFVSAFNRIAQLLDRISNDLPADSQNELLIEEYIAGAEVAVEGLLTHGNLDLLAIFDKPDPLDGPYFEETLYITPSRLPRDITAAIYSAVCEAVRAVGLLNGPIHAEVRLDSRGPIVIELAPRSIGGLCSRILRFGLEASLEEIIVRHSMGMPIQTLAREGSAVGVMMLPIPRAGRLRRVDGLVSARSVSGIEDIVITIPLGQAVEPLPEGYRYLGFIFARATTAPEVERALRTSHALLDFDIGT